MLGKVPRLAFLLLLLLFAVPARAEGPSVFVFWTSWCAHCVSSFDELRALDRELTASGGRLVMVSLDAGDPAVLRHRLGRLRPPGRLSCDGRGFSGSLARSMGVVAAPAYRVLAGDGSVRSVASLGELRALARIGEGKAEAFAGR
jgi:thiol-disulfide isomerase/thioredoxin